MAKKPTFRRKFTIAGTFAVVMLNAAIGLNLQGANQQAQAIGAPKTQNTKVEQLAVTGSLAQTIDGWTKATDTAQWLGYSVPAVSQEQQACCADWNGGHCGPCRLEGGKHRDRKSVGEGKRVDLGGRRLIKKK